MIAFLGYPGSFGHWLIHTDRLPVLVINWCIGVFLTCVILGAILRPLARRAKQVVIREWNQHKQNQRQIIASTDTMTAALQDHTAAVQRMTVALNRDKA